MREILKEDVYSVKGGLIRQLILALCIAFSATSAPPETAGSEEEKEENGGGGERIPDPLPGFRR